MKPITTLQMEKVAEVLMEVAPAHSTENNRIVHQKKLFKIE